MTDNEHDHGIPIPSSGGSWVGFVSEADWLPNDTYSFFEHAFCGVWTDELRREHRIGVVNTIALGSARETIGEG